jgi:hypothetical protein
MVVGGTWGIYHKLAFEGEIGPRTSKNLSQASNKKGFDKKLSHIDCRRG